MSPSIVPGCPGPVFHIVYPGGCGHLLTTVVDAPGGPACAADDGTDALTVDVSFKVAGRLAVPVRAVFTALEPPHCRRAHHRGRGVGFVVETHATPLGPDESGHPRTPPSSRR